MANDVINQCFTPPMVLLTQVIVPGVGAAVPPSRVMFSVAVPEPSDTLFTVTFLYAPEMIPVGMSWLAACCVTMAEITLVSPEPEGVVAT